MKLFSIHELPEFDFILLCRITCLNFSQVIYELEFSGKIKWYNVNASGWHLEIDYQFGSC
ncbi:hypothetical protein BpHYR1_043581 [Brachionus plicatilis]|uniref:Uncharacterized protein n=1 Tax=Brachionus plicatilis TaxID=10195 RepID=A0A3M7SNB1_BRAPC|nr:hypothetical protein BpHYR1_043581 [Brachionus plicatilis]